MLRMLSQAVSLVLFLPAALSNPSRASELLFRNGLGIDGIDRRIGDLDVLELVLADGLHRVQVCARYRISRYFSCFLPLAGIMDNVQMAPVKANKPAPRAMFLKRYGRRARRRDSDCRQLPPLRS